MKIVSVTPHVVVQHLDQPFGMSQWMWDVRSSCLVEVVTDEGIIGWGECFGPAAVNRALIESTIAPVLIGRDPTEHAALWNMMYNRGREWGRAGVSIAAISGVEIAMWDILGKVAGLPIYRLLGGSAPTSVACYASSFYYGPSTGRSIEQEADRLLGEGYTAFKMKVGAGPVADDVGRVRQARAALGPAARLAVDANRGFTTAEAIAFGRAVDDQDLWWFEEPVIPEDLDGYDEVRRAVAIPIAGGESEFTRWGFRDLLARRSVDLLQPDATACGGIRETMLVAGMASAHGIPTCPHVWGSSITVAVGLHLIAALPEITPSTSRQPPLLELDQAPNVFRDELADLQTGPFMTVPVKPGLGIEIDRSVIERHQL